MIDALGAPQSVLLLGGTSEIALATLRRLPRPRLRRVVLAGPDVGRLDETARTLSAEGFPEAEVVLLDARATSTHRAAIDAILEGGDLDVTVLAFGVLGDQREAEREPEEAVRVAEVNYVGAMSAGLLVGDALRRQGHGVLVVLSSVAGRQARRSNFVYGSSKAGLDAFALGLGDALVDTGAHVVVVRPGFVRTRMTAHLRPAPLAAEPDDVGAAIADGIRRRATVVYAPPAARLVALVLTHLPRPVLRRLPF